MDITEKTRTVIGQKQSLFVAYEELTETLLSCDLGDVEGLMEKRLVLQHQIDELDEQLQSVFAEDPFGGLLREAACNRCDYGDLPPELQPVFLEAQGVFTVISRIRRLEPEVVQRFEQEKAELLTRIKKANRDVGAQAAKFYTGTGGGEISRLHAKYSRI